MDKKYFGFKETVVPSIVLIAALFMVPMFLRIALIFNNDITLSINDLRGFFSDFVATLFIATLVTLLMRLWYRVWIVAVLLWGIVNYGAYEHIKALDELPFFVHAAFLLDWTFLKGSALNVSNYPLFTIIILVPVLMNWFIFRNKVVRLPISVFIISALLAMPAYFLWHKNLETPQWRQSHFIFVNLHWIFTPYSAEKIENTGAIEQFLHADLEGKPIIRVGNTGKNILLVMLEGVSGAYLDTIASRHGVESMIRLPNLDRIAKQGIVFTNFVSNQRQTDNGEYAILCGDYPNLISGTSKMSEYVQKKDLKRVCLPELLRNAGYETVYLQAAPLGFMLKDQFMPKIGFSKVYGDTWFERYYKRDMWGVDDRAFFEKGVELIRNLQGSGKPWFLTMLTVGTHHPYIVPEGFRSPYPKDSFGNAVWYLDQSVEWFYRTLEEENLLKDTVVLLTSDESLGIMEGPNDLLRVLSQNWGLLAAILPTKEQRIINENFMQVDIAISILDYLGLEDKGRMLGGRSVFREYNRRRPIFFANAHRGMIGGVDQDGNLYLCKEDFSSCKEFVFSGSSLFSKDLLSTKDVAQKTEFIESMSSLSSSLHKRRELFDIPLISDSSIPMLDGIEQMIFGKQDIVIPAGSRIDTEMELEVVGETGQVVLSLVTLAKEKGENEMIQDLIIFPPLKPGDTLRQRNSYYTEKGCNFFESILSTRKLRGGKMNLKVTNAHIRVKPSVAKAGRDPLRRQHESLLTGATYKDDEILNKAIESFQAIIKDNPNDHLSHTYLADIYSLTGQTDKAEFHYRLAEVVRKSIDTK